MSQGLKLSVKGAIWIHFECLQSLSLSAPEEPIFVSVFNYPIKENRWEKRPFWGLGKRMGDREIKKEKKGEDAGEQRFSSGCGCYYLLLLSRVWGGGRDTHAGLLSNAAETFMKSLQKQGRQALFLSSNWFSCGGCCASDFIAAAGPPPLCPHSLLLPDLETYLQLCAAPFPLGHGWAGLRQDSCGILIVTEAEPAAGSDSSQRGTRPGINEPLGAAPASNCSPSNFPYPWEHCSTKKFHQLKCCTPEHLPNVPHLTKVYSSRRCC